MQKAAKTAIMWEPKMVSEGNKFIGKFSTRVDAGTPGAQNIKGTSLDGKKSWDYHAFLVDSVHGNVVWLDKTATPFGTNLNLWLETDKGLHQIRFKYAANFNFITVPNYVCGMGKEILTGTLNVSYFVREKYTTINGKKVPEKDASGNVRWNASPYFRDSSPKFEYEAWKDYAQRNGLMVVQKTNGAGQVTYDDTAAMGYWDGKIAEVQAYLLKNDAAVPNFLNSMICGSMKNPSGAKNLSPELQQKAQEIYDGNREKYAFSWQKPHSTADDAIDHIAVGRASTVIMPETTIPDDDIITTIPDDDIITTVNRSITANHNIEVKDDFGKTLPF